MAEGAAPNEGDVVAGFDVLFRLLADEQASLAALMQAHTRLQQQVQRLPLTVDMQVTRGSGENIQKTIQDTVQRATEQAKFNWKAIARPEELSAALRSVEPELTRLAQQAEEAGKAINMAVTGASGTGSSFRISSRNDVQGFLESIRTHGQAIAGGAGRNVTLTGSLGFEPTAERLADVAGVQGAAGQAHAAARKRDDDEKAAIAEAARVKKEEEAERKAHTREIEKERKEREKLNQQQGSFMDRFALGQRPQRVIGEALTGVGMPSGIAGLGAFVGGGMLFHLGWEITNQLSKIPDRIAQQVEQYRAYEMQRASMLVPTTPAGQAVAKFNPNATLAADQTLNDIMASYGAYAQRIRSGGGGTLQEFQTQLANLQTTGVQNISTPQAAQQALRQNARYLAMASLLHEVNPTEFGDPYQTAYNLQLLNSTRGAEGRQMLANNQALLPILVKAYRDKYPQYAQADEAVVRAQVQNALQMPETFQGGRRNPYAITHEDAMNAIEQYAGGQQATQMARQRMATRTWAEWWNQWHVFYDPRGELTNRQREVLQRFSEDIGKNYNSPLTPEQRSIESERLAEEMYNRRGTARSRAFDDPRLRQQLRDRAPDYISLAESYAGLNPNAMLDLSGKPFNAPLPGPANFSFSSLSGFANKMQTEAGVNIDYARNTADGMAQAVEKLDSIDKKLGVGQPAGVQPPPAVNIGGP